MFCVVSLILSSLYAAAAANSLTEGPVSVSALVGETAVFRCAGAGVSIVWTVDGVLATDNSITDRGISSNVNSSTGTILSILSVRSSILNNGTTVQCVLLSLSGSVTSNNATLTVLPGIPRVLNVRLNPTFSTVLWDHAAGSGIMYRVILTNINTGQLIVNETTSTTHLSLPTLQLCQYYTANVTAFTAELHSDTVVTELRVPGEYYDLVILSNEVLVFNTTHSRVTFSIDIQERSVLICPGQAIMLESYPVLNISEKTLHPEVAITQPGVINFNVLIESSCHCAAEFVIVASDRDVEVGTVFFSTYMIQSCHVTLLDHTSIMVTCTLVVNADVTGLVVVENAATNETIEKRLLLQSNSVIFTSLEPGE